MCMIYSFMDRLRLTYIDDQWYLAASEVPPIPDCTLLADRMIGYVRSMDLSLTHTGMLTKATIEN